MTTLRSTFEVKPVDIDVEYDGDTETVRFVCITDLDIGMSVTNDIENVLAVLASEGVLVPGMGVVYRDTDEVWDEVVIDERCGFVTFAPLGQESRDAAIAIAISRRSRS